jgi:diguanylate cyclase (GGDEF)-like protein
MADDEPAADELGRLERRNAELELLYAVIHDLVSTLAVREVLDRLLGRVLDHLDSEIGSILLLHPDGHLRILAASGLPNEVIESTVVVPGEGISGRVAETGESVLVTDVETDPRFRRRNHERYYTHSCVSAPLLDAGAVRGVINVNNKRSREPYQESDLRLLEAIAGTASLALINAQRYEEVLERAQRDALTGLANHGHFWSTLELEFKRAERHGRPLSLVIVDVDHFKQYNDRLGHPAGDEALCSVARILETGSRRHDLVARYGGEEFAAILPETDGTGALCYAEKMRRAVEAACFGPGGGESLTISVGVASSIGDLTTARELVALADQRLYEAKAGGRNQVVTGHEL